MPNEKTFAFLIDCPSKGKFMMFPGFAEDLTSELSNYDETNETIHHFLGNWSAELSNAPHKVYRRKSKTNK